MTCFVPQRGFTMYLKEIELENFKSFGGKLTIPLMEGYLAVTGPNGSGKSNIADAILFVLGPKSSKAIRAGKLTDLIFDGGKSKNRANYTKVSLIFDNSDGILPWNDTTVKLTRHIKLSSNGEDYSSHFFINDQKSTMTEFDSLLSRARISADGYNMVQQGDVTRIVQMGAVERRRILDSISGIASYDADISKAEAEKAEAEANLDRIGIIVNELEKQLEKLKEDMDAAKQYLQLQEKLEVAKVQQVHRSLETQKSKMDYTNEAIRTNETEINELRERRETVKTLIDELILEISRVEADIDSKLGPEYKELKSRIMQIKVDIANASDRIENNELNISELEEDIALLKEELIGNDVEIGEMQSSLSDLNIQMDRKKELIDEAEATVRQINDELSSKGGEHRELQEKLEKLEVQIESKIDEETTLLVNKSSFETKKESLSADLATVEETINNATFEIKDAEWSLSQIKKDESETGVQAITQKILDTKRKEADLEKQESELAEAIRRLSNEYNQLAAEKKVSDRASGSEAVRKVLELRDKGMLKGVHGTIAQLGFVEKEYEVALATAAGGKMQAVVVDNDQVAAEAIELLKKEGSGRATFLPLNKMVDGKPRAKAIMMLKETEGYAIDLIDFDPKYRAAFWYVFADTLVSKNLTDARRIMGGIRIVTKAGELIEASGAMVGGSQGPSTAKFGSASQGRLDTVAAELRAANGSMDVLRTSLRELRDEIRKLDNEMRTANSSTVEAQGKIGKLEAQLSELRNNKKLAEERQAQIKEELRSVEDSLLKATANADKCSGELQLMKTERSDIKTRISEIAPVEIQEKLNSAREAAYNLSQELTKLTQDAAALSAELSGAEAHKESVTKDIATKENKCEVYRQEIEKRKEFIEQKNIELNANTKIEAEMESGIADLRDKKEELTRNKYEHDNEKSNLSEKIETKEGFSSQLKANIIEITGVIQQLEEEIAQIGKEVVLPLPSEDELRRTIRSCENGIASLGTVNLRAIEDYDEKKIRYDALTEDTAKLNAQIKDLTELTISLNAEKKGLFMKTYEGIDVNFRSIYAELSGGGEAYMKLENEEDPFSGGLMINAKPKNGKLLRLEALSGGEKSLTALAFIFAIQEFQPSPFYVLDEVDMFLDSVNAEMVAKRVKESSSKAQFIQVSLRKVTLALAEHLIGVTRQPSGVSKVIMQPDFSEVSKYEEEIKVNEPDNGSN